MKSFCGLLVALVLLGWAITRLGGCYVTPPVCAPNDRSCLPCTNPQSTDPSCPGWPSDTKRPTDGGTDR